jgi:hypothetical protein
MIFVFLIELISWLVQMLQLFFDFIVDLTFEMFEKEL